MTKNVGMPAVGHHHQHPAVVFRRGHGVYFGRLSSDGQSRTVHLQDHGFRRDVDEDHRRIAEASRLSMCAWSPKIRTARVCCSRVPATRCFIRSTTAATGPICKTDCRTRRFPGPWCRSNFTTWWFRRTAAEFIFWTTSRRWSRWRRAWARILRCRCSRRARPCESWAAGAAYVNFQLKNQPKGPVQAAILDGDGKVVRELRVPAAHTGLNRAHVGSALRSAAVWSRCAPRLRRIRTSGRSRASEEQNRGRSRIGARRRRRWGRWRAGEIHDAADRGRRNLHAAARDCARSRSSTGSDADLGRAGEAAAYAFATTSTRLRTW